MANGRSALQRPDVTKLQKLAGAVGAFHGIVQRANLDVGSPEPGVAQERGRKDTADKRARTRAAASGRSAEMAEGGGGAAEAGSGTAEGGARVLSQESSGVGARQPRPRRGGHQILLMGPEAGARTRQDRSRWCVRAALRTGADRKSVV